MNKKIPLHIETLTPVHIGSGEKLIKGEDVIFHDKTAVVISFDKVLNFYSQDRKILSLISERLSKGVSMFDVLPNFNEESFKKYNIQLESRARARETYVFLKDAHLTPYIPASTMKGAVRTVLLQHFIRRNNEQLLKELKDRIKRNDRKIDKFIKESVFGKNGQTDPLKCVRIDDTPFNINDLFIGTAKLFDINLSGKGYGWKRMGREGEIVDIDKATPIMIESIKPGAASSSAVYIDEYFLKHLRDKRFMRIFSDFYNEFRSIANAYASREIEGEITFLQKYNTDNELDLIIHQYNELSDMIKKQPEWVYMRSAWGIGWKGMTGDYMDKDVLEQLRKVINPGKVGSPIFPKTRRFTIGTFGDKEKPVYPMGWLKMKKD